MFIGLAKVASAIGGGIIMVLLVLAILWTISALWWGWVFMLITGAIHLKRDGHALGFGFWFPLGYLLALVLG